MITCLSPTDFDVACLRRIRMEALLAEPAAYASTAADWAALSDDALRGRIRDNPIFVAFAGDEAVGLMGLLRQTSSRVAHRATLVMVYMRQNMRGSGLATALLAAVVIHSREAGVTQLELHVSAENPAAIRFYLREGFVEIGRIPNALADDGRYSDELLLIRQIGI